MHLAPHHIVRSTSVRRLVAVAAALLAAACASDGATADLVRGVELVLKPYAAPDAPAPPPLREAREAFEGAYLDMVLTRTNNNVTAAARIAGRNRTDFYDLMRRHGRSPQRDGS